MTALTPRERAGLRSRAQTLKAIFHVGKEGVTDAMLRSLLDAFNSRDLLKVKVLGAAPITAQEAGTMIAEALEDVHHVQTIGRTVVLYRPREAENAGGSPGT